MKDEAVVNGLELNEFCNVETYNKDKFYLIKLDITEVTDELIESMFK